MHACIHTYIYIYIVGPINFAPFSRDLRQLLAALVLPAAPFALLRLQTLRRGGVAELFRGAQGAWPAVGKKHPPTK